MKKLVLMAVAATFLLSFTAMAVMAQEKAKAEKAKTTQELKAKERGPAPVLFENDKVRVVDARTKPGERNPMQERSGSSNLPFQRRKNESSLSRREKRRKGIQSG